jgi:ACS family sodium-dependent inorganic phosphate cotransporter-like MFS transporter 5
MALTCSSRLTFTLLASLGALTLALQRVALSITIVAMVNKTDLNLTAPEINCSSPAGELPWDSRTQGTLLASFFYGYIFTQIPGGWLTKRFGGRRVMALGAICSSVLSLATPVAAR